ncbi:MAG: mitochondrial fission ELM1 family protein [Pseudomonadota bacterium]
MGEDARQVARDGARAGGPAERLGRGLRSIWVVTDGRPGNENPARALAEGLVAAVNGPTDDPAAADVQIDIKRVALRPWSAALPAPLWTFGGARAGGWPFTALEDRGAALAAPYPDLVIGAGRRSAPFVLAIKRLSGGGARAVQLLDPRLDPARFDLVITPAHDDLQGPGVLSTIGSLHNAGPAALHGVSDPRLSGLKRPLIGMLVGGPSRAAQMTPEDADRWMDALRPALAAGASVAATPSRRTPKAVAARVETEIRSHGGFYWRGDGENPYRALLAVADILVATGDSVNMASEAAGAGKPLFIAPVTKLSPKLERFHAALEAGGHAQPLPARLDLTRLGPPPRLLDDRAAAVARILTFF